MFCAWRQCHSRRDNFHKLDGNWTVEDWKNSAWFQEVQVQESRVRICHQRHESMDPAHIVSTVQAGVGGLMICTLFLEHFTN